MAHSRAVRRPVAKTAPKTSAPTPRRAAANKPAPKASKPEATAKPNKSDWKLSSMLAEDSFCFPVGPTTFFVATYSTFKGNDGVERHTVTFSKGYTADDGKGGKVVNLSGKSATLPQELLNNPTTAEPFISGLTDWLLSFVQE